jgi:hypothetical protein
VIVTYTETITMGFVPNYLVRVPSHGKNFFYNLVLLEEGDLNFTEI